MLSAINQYNSLYSLTGLTQTNPLSSIYGLSQTGLGGSTSSLYGIGRQEDSYKVKLSGYGQLQSAFDTFQKALGALNSSQAVSPFKATSSSESVLTATTSKDVKNAGTYSVNVNQLAQAQTLKSATVADANSTIVGTGSLTIQVGTYNSNLNTFTSPTANSVTVNISASNGTLNGIAGAINNANAGVKASVVTASGGGYQLQLTAANSGTDNTVKITAADTYGVPQTGSTALGQLAFDPTAAAGSGKNLTQTTAAQNALLTVDGTNVVSQSNNVSNAINGVTLNLVTTGTSSVTVNVNRDSAAFQASAQKFVDAFNALQKTVNSLTVPSPGNTASLANDSVTGRLSGQVSNAVTQAGSGYGNNRLTMADIGITRQADGTLSLDATKLQSAFSTNPEGATSLLANTAQSVSNIVTRGTGSTSELSYVTQSLQHSVQGLQTQRAVLQNYSTNTMAFGLPTDYSLFNYVLSSSTAGIARYTGVSRL